MKDGFIRVCAVTPQTVVADVAYNCVRIAEAMEEAERGGAKIVVFPDPVLPQIR